MAKCLNIKSNAQFVKNMLDHYSRFNPSPLSIKQFIDFGRSSTEYDSFRFLRKEVPVRLANIIKEIQLLPDQLLVQPSCRFVQDLYIQSFCDVVKFDSSQQRTPCDPSTLAEFWNQLEAVRDRHRNVVQTMAEGVIEMKESVIGSTHLRPDGGACTGVGGAISCDCNWGVSKSIQNNIQYFLDRFYMMRISIRMLINQHTILFGKSSSRNSNAIGTIDPYCCIYDVIQDAAANAKFLCDGYYLTSPDVIVKQKDSKMKSEQIITDARDSMQFVYVPSHLYHILFELLKNAMRAVVEFWPSTAAQLPPVELLVVSGDQDLTIKISDRGGGVPRSQADRLFDYMYSTAPKPTSCSEASPIAGFGYGLPLSRLYARYFQGDIIVNSFDGYGTDAIIYLKALADHANEFLPIYNRSCERRYRNNQTLSHDWSIPNSQTNGVRNLVFQP